MGQKLGQHLLNNLHIIRYVIKLNIEKKLHNFNIIGWSEFPSDRSLKTASKIIIILHVQKQPPEMFCKKKLLLEISPSSQENTCARVSFGTLLKRRLWHRCFPVNLAKFLRTPFLQNTSTRRLQPVWNFLWTYEKYFNNTFLEVAHLSWRLIVLSNIFCVPSDFSTLTSITFIESHQHIL